MAPPTPSVTQPRMHLWFAPPFGTTAVETHGAFLPMCKLYLAGSSTSSLTSGDSVRNRWAGYGFDSRDDAPSDFADRIVTDQLAALQATWGLADAHYNIMYHIAFSVSTGSGLTNLNNHATDAITGSYRDLDRTLYTDAGIDDVATLFTAAGQDIPGLIDDALIAASKTAFRPTRCFQDIEQSRARLYNACNAGVNGNYDGQVLDARSTSEAVIADLTHVSWALAPYLGHDSDIIVDAIDIAMTAYGNTNITPYDGTNIVASREYEAWSMAGEDSAMARAIYANVLEVFSSAVCGNYDVTGWTHAEMPHRFHGDKLGARGYATPAAHLFDASCPVLYPLDVAMDEDQASLLEQGWGVLSPSDGGTAIDTLSACKAHAESKISAMKAEVADGGTCAPWIQFPGIGNGGATNPTWVHHVEYTTWLLTRLFTEQICTDIIIWSWETEEDWDLLVSVVNKAAASAGISW